MIDEEKRKMGSVAEDIISDKFQCVGLLWYHAEKRKFYVMSLPGPEEDFFKPIQRMDVVVEGQLKDIADR